MRRNIFALLIGINEYLGGVTSLSGCVNDVKRMHEFLLMRTSGDEFEFHPLALTSGDHANLQEIKPTRQTVIESFREHLCKAGENDVALFYYSGHGSQEKAPPEFWYMEPDRLDETIVCYDSRTENKWDLADKELAILIAEVAKRNPHIVVILDSCHSGSCTRAAEATGIRLAPSDRRDRPLDSFEGYRDIVKQKSALPNNISGNNWITLPEGKHIVISACRAEEVANERFLGEDIYGVMSFCLLDTLQRTSSNLTYRDIFARMSTLVRNQVALQNPVIEAGDVKQLQEPFLGGAVQPIPAYFSLTHRKSKGWVINAGAIHGISAPVGDETTTLAVFALSTNLATVSKLEEAVGFGKVTSIEAGESQVEFELKSADSPERKAAFNAIVISQPLPPVGVKLEGDEEGLNLIRQGIATAAPDEKPSLIVRESTVQAVGGISTSIASLTVTAKDGRYLIRRTADAYPLMVPVDEFNKAGAHMAVQRLEHIIRWLQIAELENKTSNLPPNAISMEFYAVSPDGSPTERIDISTDIRLEYRWEDGKWIQPHFMLRLANNTEQRLYCMLFDLTETFAVRTAGLLKGGGEWLNPKGQLQSEIWAYTYYKGKPIPASIKKDLRDQGVVAFRDIIKLIVSTTESNATLLERDDLKSFSERTVLLSR